MSGCTSEELGALSELARGQIVLELGAEYGASTVAMARVAARLCSVDWHYGDEHSSFKPTLGPFLANLRAHDLEIVAEHRQVKGYDYRRLMDSWDGGRDDQTRGRNDATRKAVCVHVGRFQEVIPALGTVYTLAFIDGLHTEQAVERDLRLVTPVLRPEGKIVCHDFGRFGVERGIARCADLGWTVRKVVGTLAILERGERWDNRAGYDL